MGTSDIDCSKDLGPMGNILTNECSPTRLETRSKEFSTCAKANSLQTGKHASLLYDKAAVKAFNRIDLWHMPN